MQTTLSTDKWTRLLVLSTILSIASCLAYAQQPGPASGVPGYSRAASDVVIEYFQIIPMLAWRDPRPRLRIYGDGRYIAHYPLYMKKAGQYEGQMRPGELRNLIETINRDGLLDFDLRQVESQVHSIEFDRRQRASADGESTEAYAVSDQDTVRIVVHLTTNGETDLREIVWSGLLDDARRFPGIEALVRLRALRTELEKLSNAPGLRRLDTH